MADTIREQIIKNAVTRAGTIRTAAGFNTDIGVNAVRDLKTLDEGTALVVEVISMPEESTKAKFGKMDNKMPIALKAAVKLSTTQNIHEISEAIYGDLVKSMTDPAAPFSALIDSITHTGGGGVETPKNEERFASAIATFDVKYKTILGNPYAQ
ncbi:MAG: hypothetical protein JEZ12_26590 [Desulfobacterium sp.]|nr:hypothetical protein [Desulfobacterium sp.]